MDLQRLAGTLEADHGREDGTLRSRERLDPWVGGEDVLDVLGVDLEPVGERDHVLLAPVEPEEAVLVEPAEVAGVEPAGAVDRGRGRLRIFPVALEDVRAARDHLAVGRELHVDARNGNTHRTETVAVEPVEGKGR